MKRPPRLRGLWRAMRERLRPERRRAEPMPVIEPGPRCATWLILAPRPETEIRARRLAGALERGGESVVCALANARDGAVSDASIVPWSLHALRGLLGRDEWLRVIVQSPTSEAIALAREAHARGARVLYDAAGHPASGSGWYELATEQALVEAADDVIASNRALSRHLAALGGGRRIVHLLPDPEVDTSEAWLPVASSLRAVVARPTVTILLVAKPGSPAVERSIDAFLAARGDLPYRATLVLPADHPEEPALEARAERGELTILRSPRAGRAAAWNLGLRATSGQIVVLADTCLTPLAGWLEPALEALDEDRRVGAVGLRAGRWPAAARPGAIVVEGEAVSSRTGRPLRVAALSAAGMVAPRSVLARTEGLPESDDLAEYDEADLCLQIRALGYEIRALPAMSDKVKAAELPSEESPGRASGRALLKRWSHRPELLAPGSV